MKKTVRSLGYSITGLTHALKSEVNLRRFMLGHLLLILLAVWIGIDLFSILLGTIVAAFFTVVELLNTAVERLADTVDDCEKAHRGGHYHPGIKLTKDVAASASLIALIIYCSTILLIALPYALYRFSPQ